MARIINLKKAARFVIAILPLGGAYRAYKEYGPRAEDFIYIRYEADLLLEKMRNQ